MTEVEGVFVYIIGQPEGQNENFHAEELQVQQELGITEVSTNKTGSIYRHFADAKKVGEQLAENKPRRKLLIAQIPIPVTDT